MRLHRFFGNFDFRKERFTVSDLELVNQWRNVLRLETGDEVLLCDGKRSEARAKIAALNKNAAEVEILDVIKNENEPKVHVTLYCSILKREHFELAAGKATEVGAAEIAPIVCERTVKRSVRRERLEKIIKEAAEQSGRGIIPALREPMAFAEALEDAKKNGENFFFDLSGRKFEGISVKRAARLGVFIGPEGGWTETEISIAKESGFEITSLGTLMLRAETAAIVAVYSVLSVRR